MFGCMPGGYKQKVHILANNSFELSDIFLDICNVVKPKLSIMDAVIGLDGGPSTAGKPIRIGRILTSTDPVSLDIIAGKILGYEPEEILTLIRAKERRIIDDFYNIRIIGILPKIKFKKILKGTIDSKKKKDSMFITDTFVNPIIILSKCNLCFKCVKYCAPKAIIKNNNSMIKIDYNKCINCYFCLSICQNNAIKTKSTIKNKLINIFRYLLKI